MALFAFRARINRGDVKADVCRFESFRRLLSGFGAEIRQEIVALEGRHERVLANAAFSMQALENGGVSDASASNMETLAVSISWISKRTVSLKNQLEFIDETNRSLSLFAKREGIDALQPALGSPDDSSFVGKFNRSRLLPPGSADRG